MRLVTKQTKLSDSIIIGVLCCFYFALNSLPVSATSTISISTPASLDLELTPTNQGVADVQTSNVIIKTSGTEGFKVLLSSKNPDLVNRLHPEKTISSVKAETTSTNLPLNTWGIYLGASSPSSSTLFSPIPTTPTEFARQDLADASGTYKLAAATKVDTSLPAGMYQSQLVISVVASLPEKIVTDLTTATYMQDITPEICANSKIWESEADSVTLIDKRDNKTYKVARLKDGNCWMQEDLKLSLSTDKPLSSETSDISPNEDGSIREWVPGTTLNRGVWTYNGFSYYNWLVATAGSGQAIFDQGTITTQNNAAPDSICPKGWKLPLSGTVNNAVSGSFQNMIKWYGGALYATPTSFRQVGFFEANGQLQVYGKDVYYWSRNAWEYGSEYVYNCYYGEQGSGIEPSNRNAYSKGFVVRCVSVSAE